MNIWSGNRSRRSVVTGLVMALALAPILAAAPAQAANEAKAFLDAIYQRYVGRSDAQAKGVPLATAKAVHDYFTVGLASLILEDRATAAKRNEAPALDGDPFVGSQEWDISDLAIDVKESAAYKASATITFTNAGKPQKVAVELLRSGKDWRIADIAWDSGTLRGLYRRKAVQQDSAR